MSTSLLYIDSYYTPCHKMAFNNILEIRNNPLLTYNNNNYDFSIKEYTAFINSLLLS
jgi:hypothetical protein